MTYSHISNSTRTILRKASLRVACKICDVLNVIRTCLMYVSETWCFLLLSAMLISVIELWTCGFYEDIKDTMFPVRNAVLHLILMILKMCTATCYFLSISMSIICMSLVSYQEMGPGIQIKTRN